MADTLDTPYVSSIMLPKNRFNPYAPNRPSNFFRYEYSCEEISAGWLIGGMIGGAIGYWAGKSYTSGASVPSDAMGDFIFQGMKVGAYIGEDIHEAIYEYDYPESDFINNMDYYQWLQTVQNGK